MKPEECTIGKLVEYKGEILQVASRVDDEGRVICKGGKRFKRAGQYQVEGLNEAPRGKARK